jgi:hypothetical protein
MRFDWQWLSVAVAEILVTFGLWRAGLRFRDLPGMVARAAKRAVSGLFRIRL